jgi:hypothetical protein
MKLSQKPILSLVVAISDPHSIIGAYLLEHEDLR